MLVLPVRSLQKWVGIWSLEARIVPGRSTRCRVDCRFPHVLADGHVMGGGGRFRSPPQKPINGNNQASLEETLASLSITDVSQFISLLFAPRIFTRTLLSPDPTSSQWYVKVNSVTRSTEATKNVSNRLYQEHLEHPVSPACPAIAPPPFPCCSGSSILIDGHFERSLTERQAYRWKGKESTKGDRCTYCVSFAQLPTPTVDWCDVARVTIDMLPDVALLEIFHFYVDDHRRTEAWHTLVHVCRKWRNVIFGSPRRLNLRLSCKARTPVREMIDAWPVLPIHVSSHGHDEWGVDNITAALEHNDRIRELDLAYLTSSQMEKVFAAMQRPFPALDYLYLYSESETSVVPASFLGGSAPQLQRLRLNFIPFPELPKLLLSATHLVTLGLSNIPHSGYMSPEVMVTSLSALTSLEVLRIRFKSPQSRLDRRRRPPPLARILLPALTRFTFKGVSEYLDDLIARIDAPLLDELHITFFHQLIFDTPQLTQFINRTPNFKAHAEAHVEFSDWGVWVETINEELSLGILCKQSDWQLSFLAQVCGSSFIPTIERLNIKEIADYPLSSWQDDIETAQWLELLHQLTAVRYLHISPEFMPRIAPTLQELVGGGVTEVLPALQTLFLNVTLLSSGVRETIDKFVAARELAGHPIDTFHWD